jgi:glycosyltransferase involved in cell wall biosynthesis
MSKVTVVIPTYNRAEMVKDAIKSVLNQTYTDFDIVVVDDGSTDNTKESANSFKDPRIKYIFQENMGVSASRNTGIRAAASEYVSFLDSDDIYLESSLEKIIRTLTKYPSVGWVYGDSYAYGKSRKPRIRSSSCETSRVIEPIEQVRALLSDIITLSTVTAKRTCLEEIGGFNEDLWFCEDYYFLIRMAKKYHSFYIKEPLIYYRLHSGQTSNVSNKPGKERAFPLILDEVFKDPGIAPLCEDLKRETLCHFYGIWMVRSWYGVNMKMVRYYLKEAIKSYPKVILSKEIFYMISKYFASMLPVKLAIFIKRFRRRFLYFISWTK